MDKVRTNIFALILLDALEDENESDILNIIERNETIDPSYIIAERGISPLHYASGMENAELGLRMVKIFLEMGASPNPKTSENVTPLHVAAIHGRLEIVRLLLQHGARVDIYDEERKSPLHYAIEECHFEVLQLMRDHIFLDKFEQRQKQQRTTQKDPINKEYLNDYGPTHRQFNSYLQKPAAADNHNTSPVEIRNKNLTVAKQSSEEIEKDKYTPNRLHYNYDKTSPYYINITHRRHNPQPKYPSPRKSELSDLTTILVESSPETETRPLNIFTLTKEHIEEFALVNQAKNRSRISLIEVWREKVKRSNARRSILREFDNVTDMVETVMESDQLNFENTVLNCEKSQITINSDSDSGACDTARTSSNENFESQEIGNVVNEKKIYSLGQIIQKVAQAHLVNDDDIQIPITKQSAMPCVQSGSNYLKVPEIVVQPEYKSSNFNRSPIMGNYYLQMTEAYVHTDDENGLVFYETKLLSNQGNFGKQNNAKTPPKSETSFTSRSTDFTIPLDYETDALRAELTTFGEPPGPITKSTKRLYIKRLIKYKRRKTTEELQRSKSKAGDENKIEFSVELYRSVRSLEHFQRIVDYMKYDVQSTEYFANHQQKQKMREGHLKQSFIYFLIDPRVSSNLPGESIYLEKFDVWKRFLESIFYVGKGKTSRPYSHLYDAMKLHSRLNNAAAAKDAVTENEKKVSIRKQKLNMELFKTKSAQPASDGRCVSHSKKLERILDIWANSQGVVCLHVFHNIIPAEAYTREAAIIEALGLTHLTNVKRGDYYGLAKTWTMREKKFYGIALLYKAMKIYLAEGESQLSPSDLI